MNCPMPIVRVSRAMKELAPGDRLFAAFTIAMGSSALRGRVASHPSMTGRLMSMSTTSGRSRRTSSTPCWPSSAMRIS